jgi:hypothetical protein
VGRLAELLVNVVRDTRGRVEKKASQTYEELLAEQAEAEAEDAPEVGGGRGGRVLGLGGRVGRQRTHQRWGAGWVGGDGGTGW